MSDLPATFIELLRLRRDERSVSFTYLDDELSVRLERSFAETIERAARFARKLQLADVQPGDRVVLLLEKNHEFIEAFLGAMILGAIPVPASPPGPFESSSRCIERVDAIAASAEPRLTLVSSSVLEHLHVREGSPALSVVDLSTLTGDEQPVEWHDAQPSELAFLQYTSGSLRAPRGVRVSHGSLMTNVEGIMRCNEAGPHDVGLSWLPLYHDMGLISSIAVPLLAGMSFVHMPTSSFARRPARWMRALSRFKATYGYAPNFAFSLAMRRCDRPAELDLSRVRFLGCASEPINPATIRSFYDHFASAGLSAGTVVPAYGMAEVTVAASFCEPGAALDVDVIDRDAYEVERIARPASPGHRGGNVAEFVNCGRALPGHRIAVVDESLRPLPDRTVGEIVLSGPSTGDGYWNDPVASAEVFVDDHVVRTGDLGYIADGRVFVTGRLKDLIIVNGRNIAPQDIEEIAHGVSGVRVGNVVAISVPGRDSERVVVVAESNRDEPAIAEEIRKQIRQHIGLELSDVVLVQRGVIPKTSSGKLQRQKVRADYLAKH